MGKTTNMAARKTTVNTGGLSMARFGLVIDDIAVSVQ